MMDKRIGQLMERVALAPGSAVDTNIVQRVTAAAAALNRMNILHGQFNVCLSRMAELLIYLYARDDAGMFANVDPETGRILIPVPWGDTGWKVWGLRNHEAVTLRRLLLGRLAQRRRLVPLFGYPIGERGNRWYLSIDEYPTIASANAWIEADGPTLAEFRKVMQQRQAQEQARQQAQRENNGR